MGRGAEMDGCGKFIRYLMFITNFVIWVGSIVVLSLGIWTVVDKPYLQELLGTSLYMTAAYILIATGAVIFLVSFLGCFGALKEIKCMLLTYFIVVLLLFVILLIGGILGYVFREKAESNISKTMIQTIREYGLEDKEKITNAWNDLQQAMKCCGSKAPKNWLDNNKFDVEGKQVPESCCKKKDGEYMECQTSPNEDNSYTDGCFYKALDFVEEHAIVIGGIAISVALIMLLGLVFSMCLFKMIK